MSQRSNVSTLHISGLDGLRGIAILSVLFHHLMIIDIAADSPLRTFSGGFLGVDLFFVISGFLITWLALAEFKLTGGINVRHFYMRRALRLIPALVFFLLVQVLYAAYSGQLDEYLPTVMATLFYYLNWKAYFTLVVATGFGHLWSLSVEEQFYMVWPLFLLLLFRTGRPWLFVTTLVMIAIVISVYRNDLWHETGNWFHLYLRTDLRLDAFVLGALCAIYWPKPYLSRFFSGRLVGSIFFTLFLILTFLLNVQEAAYYEWGASAVALLGCGMVLNCNSTMLGTGGIFNWPWLEYIGRRSYGIYLWHFPIFIWCTNLLEWIDTWVVIAIALAMTALLTEFSWRVIERPFNRLKTRFSHRAGHD